MELKIDSAGSGWTNALDIGGGHVVVSLTDDSKLYVESPVSGSALSTSISDVTIGTGTFHKVEITQSLIVDQVSRLAQCSSRTGVVSSIFTS